MRQDTCFGAFPFVQAKADENNDSNNHTCQDPRVRPGEETTAQVESSQKESKARCEKTESGKIEMTELLPEGKVVQPSVSFWRPVSEEDANRCQTPECHLDPLEEISAWKQIRTYVNVRRTSSNHFPH